MTKILLMTLPEYVGNGMATILPPLGLQYLASNIDNKHEVILGHQAMEGENIVPDTLNAKYYGWEQDAAQKIFNGIKPDVIGLSCVFSYQHIFLKRYINYLNTFFPGVRLVVGGNHATAYHKRYPKFGNYMVIHGEGEEAFNLYLEGELVEGKEYHVQDIDTLKYPERLGMEDYFKRNAPHDGAGKGKRVVNMITSRGCARNCIFCSVKTIWGKQVRAHSPEYVIGEVDSIVNNLNAEEIHFEDDNLIWDRDRMIKICEGIKKYNIKWTCPNGMDLTKLDKELIGIMKASGCYRITICPESYNDNVLAFYRKPFNTKMIKEKFEMIKESGIEVVGYFIVGAPDETPQEIWNTLKFALEFDSFDVSALCPYLGTELYDYCEKNNLLTCDYESENYISMMADIVGQIKNKNLDSSMLLCLIGTVNLLHKHKVEL